MDEGEEREVSTLLPFGRRLGRRLSRPLFSHRQFLRLLAVPDVLVQGMSNGLLSDRFGHVLIFQGLQSHVEHLLFLFSLLF